MLTLFAATTTEGWTNTMHSSMDVTRIKDRAPELNADLAVGLYFIVFMMLLSFFFINLFIGYVIVTFRETSEKAFVHCPFSKAQRQSIHYCLTAKPRKNFRPINASRIRIIAYNVAQSAILDYFILTVIVLNIVVLMIQHHGMSKKLEVTLHNLNVVFTAIFAFEAVLKLYALGLKGYGSNPWNVFDAVVVLGSLLDIALNGQGFNMSFLRLFRAFRLIKLMRKGELKQLVWTFFRALRSLPWVVLLIGIVLFIYSVIGMQLFGRIALHEDREINSNTNFRTFPKVRAGVESFHVSSGCSLVSSCYSDRNAYLCF
jgi:hypothetical protein